MCEHVNTSGRRRAMCLRTADDEACFFPAPALDMLVVVSCVRLGGSTAGGDASPPGRRQAEGGGGAAAAAAAAAAPQGRPSRRPISKVDGSLPAEE